MDTRLSVFQGVPLVSRRIRHERSGAMRKPTVTDRSVEKLVGVYTVLAHMVTDILSLCGYLLFIVLTFAFDRACFKLKSNQLPSL